MVERCCERQVAGRWHKSLWLVSVGWPVVFGGNGGKLKAGLVQWATVSEEESGRKEGSEVLLQCRGLGVKKKEERKENGLWVFEVDCR